MIYIYIYTYMLFWRFGVFGFDKTMSFKCDGDKTYIRCQVKDISKMSIIFDGLRWMISNGFDRGSDVNEVDKEELRYNINSLREKTKINTPFIKIIFLRIISNY